MRRRRITTTTITITTRWRNGTIYKQQNFLKHLHTSLIIVHRYKQHGVTPRKAFYKRLKEGKAIYFERSFPNFPVDPYYEPLVQFMIS